MSIFFLMIFNFILQVQKPFSCSNLVYYFGLTLIHQTRQDKHCLITNTRKLQTSNSLYECALVSKFGGKFRSGFVFDDLNFFLVDFREPIPPR
jgi:hypothetical protein